MRTFTIEERDLNGARIIARFRMDGQPTDEPFEWNAELLPDPAELLAAHDALHDYILTMKDKAVEVHEKVNSRAKKDAELLSATTEVENQTLAAAESHKAFVAAQAKRAEESVKQAEKAITARKKAAKK